MKFAGFAKNPANRGVVTFLDAYDGKDAELPVTIYFSILPAKK